jgi:hypothetical protein
MRFNRPLTLLFIFFVICFSCLAQYKPFDLKNIYWSLHLCKTTDNTDPKTLNYNNEVSYRICNDTVVMNGLKYRTIYQKTFQYKSNGTPYPGNYYAYGYLRQDSVLKRTYLRMPEWDKDSLLMDYNLKVGDVINRGYYYYAALQSQCNTSWTIKRIGNLTLGMGIHAKVFFTDTSKNSAFFAEGAGHCYGMFHNNFSFYPFGEKYCLPVKYCSAVTAANLTSPCNFNQEKENEEIPDKSIFEVYPTSDEGTFSIKSLVMFTEFEVRDVYGNLKLKQKTKPTDFFEYKTSILNRGYYFIKITLKNKLEIITNLVVAE